jgi:hypothetical protein
MLGILGYLGAVAALFVGAIFGLMVLLGESAELGRTLGAYSDPKAGAAAPARALRTEAEASEASRTTGLASADRPSGPEVRPKAPKSKSVKTSKRKKRTSTRER